ncbi:hypothetical protein BJF78_07005 [Pseudonocardia sp. CNS-139]|nr:hypothetical protein BJF78_07005 [Pseudonocardia sp. CNS-139]
MNRDGVAGSVVFHGSQNLEPLPFLDSVGTRLFRTGGPDEIEMSRESLEKVKVGLRIYNHWLSDACSIEPERTQGWSTCRCGTSMPLSKSSAGVTSTACGE